MTILSFLLLWTILKGAQTLTISPSWLEKWVFHGSSLLAQLHQKWLKLWGLLTLQSPESNLWRDLLQWPTQSMYHYHLTSLWTVLTVFSCLYVTERRETLKPRFCSWNSAGNQKLLWKKKQKTNPSEARWILFPLLVVSSFDVGMSGSVCVSVHVLCFFTSASIRIAGA